MAVTVVTARVFSATTTLAVAPPPLLVITGASFTSVTTMVAVSKAWLNAVLPPLTVASTFTPAVPLVPSQPR